MNINRIFLKFNYCVNIFQARTQVSFAQCGEDLIVKYLFNSLGIKYPTYIDIGTNEPIKGNNTYLFYTKKSSSVCIEPDISLVKKIKKERPKDIILNVGIAMDENEKAIFYYFDGKYSAWNTFSESEANKRSIESGIPFSTTYVELRKVNTIIEKYFNGKVNFISIDVEGLDLEILKSIDFEKYQPEIICVETISFSLINNVIKDKNIIDFMLGNNYIVYADTNINTIFCRKDLF